MPERTYYLVPDLDSPSRVRETDGYDELEKRMPTSYNRANLIGSMTREDNFGPTHHMPALDIDLPCQLFESRTRGHFHLYIEKEMTHLDYMKLLTVLAEVGIIEWGYAAVSRARGQTFLRKPLGGNHGG